MSKTALGVKGLKLFPMYEHYLPKKFKNTHESRTLFLILTKKLFIYKKILACKNDISVSSFVMSPSPGFVVKAPFASSISLSGWATSTRFLMWVLKADVPQSRNMLASSKPATCSFIKSSTTASPHSREEVEFVNT